MKLKKNDSLSQVGGIALSSVFLISNGYTQTVHRSHFLPLQLLWVSRGVFRFAACPSSD